MTRCIPVRNLFGLLVSMLAVEHLGAQTLASETFDSCYTGHLSCPGWAGDGYVEDLRGDYVLALSTASGTPPAATWHLDSANLAAGRTYRVSLSMRAENSAAGVSVVAHVVGKTGETERFTGKGVRGTSSWVRLNLVFAPSINGSLKLSIESGKADYAHDGPTHAGSWILIDDIVVAESMLTQSRSFFSNVCPDGKFADLAHSENDCQDLHVSTGDLGAGERDILENDLHIDVGKVLGHSGPLGFDHYAPVSAYVALPDGTSLVSECTHEAVQSAIDAAISGHVGVVRLPECVMSIDKPIVVKDADNLVLEGSGVGLTVVDRQRGARARPAIMVDRSRNLIIRDLSLRLNGFAQANIQIKSSDNVLVERIAVSDAGSASIMSIHTTRITVRYSMFRRGPKAFGVPGCQGHWFSSDQPSSNDRNRDGKGSTSECELKWNEDFSPGSTWSAAYSAYSNLAFENSFALHLTLAEIAGNRFIRSAGNKTADASFVWIHDNEFGGDPPGGARIATLRTSSDGIVDRTPSYNLFYHNRFVDNEFVPIRIMEPDVFAVDNEFVGKVGIRSPDSDRMLRIGSGASICSGTSEHDLLLRGDLGRNPPRVLDVVPGGICDINHPGTFWSGTGINSDQ